MTKTMISNLSRDLSEEILSRFPFRSMRALQVTCKKWDIVTKTTSFAKKHVAKSATTTTSERDNFMMISVMNYNLYLLEPYAEPKGKITCLSEQVKISRIFHCDGLLLCISKENDTTRLMVMNPYVFGMKYMILKLILGKVLMSPTPYWCIAFCNHGVSLKGNTYWPAQERTFDDCYCNSIICFDFIRERFGPLLPLPNTVYLNELTMSMCIYLVSQNKNSRLCFNTMKQTYMSLRHGGRLRSILRIIVEQVLEICYGSGKMVMVPQLSEGFFIDEEKKVAMGFDEIDYPNKFNIIGEDGYVRELDFEVHDTGYDPIRFSPHVCSYVPSLVKIKNRTRRKRKREDALEKLRFNQNMLRLAAFEIPNLIHNA